MTSVWKLGKKGMPVHISSDAQSVVVASVTINHAGILITNANTIQV